MTDIDRGNMDDYPKWYKQFLIHKDIYHKDDICPKCKGFGQIAYPSTSTWMGGIGGSAITNGVCDNCWGSGDITRKWANLKEIQNKIKYQQQTIDELNNIIRGLMENKQ